MMNKGTLFHLLIEAKEDIYVNSYEKIIEAFFHRKSMAQKELASQVLNILCKTDKDKELKIDELNIQGDKYLLKEILVYMDKIRLIQITNHVEQRLSIRNITFKKSADSLTNKLRALADLIDDYMSGKMIDPKKEIMKKRAELSINTLKNDQKETHP